MNHVNGLKDEFEKSKCVQLDRQLIEGSKYLNDNKNYIKALQQKKLKEYNPSNEKLKKIKSTPSYIDPFEGYKGGTRKLGKPRRVKTIRGNKPRRNKTIRGGKWSNKYKKSINCKNPKGFSQKQYCKSKKRR